MASAKKRGRTYSSPLREEQAAATRAKILEALADLLARHPSDELSTKQIAQRAGVSEPTVYRYFPDRTALMNALAQRVSDMADAARGSGPPETLDDIIREIAWAFEQADAHVVEATADAVLNADPRRISDRTRERTEHFNAVVARSLPALRRRDQHRVAALLRTLGSVQTWLRMRELHGLPGSDSGPLVAWAMKTLVDAIRRGKLPTRAPDA